MSWNYKAMGPVEDVRGVITEKAMAVPEAAAPASKRTQQLIQQLVELLATEYPGSQATFQTSGHLDGRGGNISIRATVG